MVSHPKTVDISFLVLFVHVDGVNSALDSSLAHGPVYSSNTQAFSIFAWLLTNLVVRDEQISLYNDPAVQINGKEIHFWHEHKLDEIAFFCVELRWVRVWCCKLGLSATNTQMQTYEDRLKIDRLEDRTSLCLVKNENFLCHINMFGTAHQPTVQGSCDHSQMTSFDCLKIG